MFNPGDQAVDSAHQFIKLPVNVGALVINKSLKFILGHTHSLKSEGDSPHVPDMVSR